MNAEINNSQTVYVLVGKKHGFMSERIKKLLRLNEYNTKIVLVDIGDASEAPDNIQVNKIPNPTGILRIFKLGKIKRRIDRYIYFPSVGVLYIRRMKKVVERCIKYDLEQNKSVCLITSVPPHTVCLVGMYIKNKYPNVRWLIDWRDLWSYDENYLRRTPGIYRNRLLKLEKKFMELCDKNITTNVYSKNVLVNEYNIQQQRVICINQSFDNNDFIREASISKSQFLKKKRDEINIGYIGTLFKPPKVPGKKILEAIKYVNNAGINIKFHHYGKPPSATDRTAFYFQEYFKFHGYKSHGECLKMVSKCDFLLLALADLPNCRALVSIKLPDYLLVGRPIIAITPIPSATSDIVEKTNSGYIIPSNLNWGNELLKLLNRIIDDGHIPTRNEREIAAYDWKNVSRQWINIINGMSIT